MQVLPNGGGGVHPEPQRRQPCRPMWQGGPSRGGGVDPSIGPRALETLGRPTSLPSIGLIPNLRAGSDSRPIAYHFPERFFFRKVFCVFRAAIVE